MHDATPHELVPQAIDNRPSKPAVVGMSHQCRELLQSLFTRRSGIDLTKFRKQPFGFGLFSDRLIAAMNLHWLSRIDGRQTVSFFQLPSINKTIVTRRTFQVNPEKRLRHALSKLDLNRLSGTHFATPANTINVTLTRGSWWGNEFTGKLIERFVTDKCLVEPTADLLSTAGDKTRAAVIIAEQIIEERKPVFGVTNIVVQKVANNLLAFVRSFVGHKSLQFLRFRKQPDQIERNSSQEYGVIYFCRTSYLMRRKISIENSVDRI